ncbi:hypothetical protein PQC38_gp001 [Aeromonas phage BUCT695]|uniref:hypothetical protein n=1 Tax=Aeromonas phage BUCT695 TaxID=2908630 RepID=UPI002329745D|nr:hypothetical protein PQC38_gp001 [Aeromonas phage BUCT695]UIW10477.1 hypothetical protein [Aeromonas phage BUCT695]
MSNAIIVSTKTAAEVNAQIAVVGEHESRSKVLVGQAAFEVLAHAIQHGDISLANNLINVVTPANRTAIVLLLKECTEFKYNTKEKKFDGKDKTLDDDAKLERMAALEMFVRPADLANKVKGFGGDLWAWFEATKEKDAVTVYKFNEKAMIKQMMNYLKANNLSDFDTGFEEILNKAKDEAKKEASTVDLIAARVTELVGFGLDKKLAEQQAAKDLADGKLVAAE